MFGWSLLRRVVTELTVALVFLDVVSTQSFYIDNHKEYGERLKEMVQAAERTIAVESTWQQISKDYPRIMGTTQSLYWSIQNDIIDNADDTIVLSSAYALKQELQRNLILRNVEVLANSMSLEGTMLKGTLPNIRDHLMRNYELDVVQDIFTKAIDELYYLKGVEHLSNALELITLGTSNCGTLELYAHSRLYLFRKFMLQADVNDQYILDEAHFMRNLRSQNLSPGTERRLEIAIASLPNATVSLPNDFPTLPLVRVTSGETFCLRNVEKNSYMFMPRLKDHTDPGVYTYVTLDRPPVFNATQWQLHSNTEYDGKNNRVQYAFWNPYLKQYTHFSTDRPRALHSIFGVLGGKIHQNSYWDLKTEANKLVFSHNGYNLCASDKILHLEGTKRLKLKGFKDKNHTDSNPACQWVAERCPFY